MGRTGDDAEGAHVGRIERVERIERIWRTVCLSEGAKESGPTDWGGCGGYGGWGGWGGGLVVDHGYYTVSFPKLN